jgi:hypothetical protein
MFWNLMQDDYFNLFVAVKGSLIIDEMFLL